MTDWNAGEYERTAAMLMPAAQTAVSSLAPQPGQRIVDVACGTGNASLLLAQAGAEVAGIDLAERLVAAAAERGQAAGLGDRASFSVADAESLPFEDASFDGAVSVFGVIFADPAVALPELLRVVRPGGRIVVTSWVPAGGIFRVLGILKEALSAPPRVDHWRDAEQVASLFAPRDAEIREHLLEHRAASVDAYLAEQMDHHPMWIEARQALTQAGTVDEVRARVKAAYEEENESSDGFAVTSRYLVTTVSV